MVRVIVGLGFISLTLLFQNCGSVQFNSPHDAVLASGALGDSGGKVEGDGGSDWPSNQRLSAVECDLGGANQKIVLKAKLMLGANSVESRICMSPNACLNILNNFAKQRDCSLDGAAKNSINAQCTNVFPGSIGVCKKAKILSDADVLALLAKMSASSKN